MSFGLVLRVGITKRGVGPDGFGGRSLATMLWEPAIGVPEAGLKMGMIPRDAV